jgi:pimeloyl-ACP methyl ester carboxylesterase
VKQHFHLSDLRGIARLAAHATVGVTHIVEAVHHNISPVSKAMGVSGLVYESIRSVAKLAGTGVDASLEPIMGILQQDKASPEREAVVAAINGVIGDHLAEDGNPLAISMALRYEGKTLALDPEALKTVFPKPGSKLIIMVHGLCMSDRQWAWKGHHHGRYLEKETGYTPLYLRYNSGLHISSNGRAMAAIMEDLMENWPVPIEEIVIVGHSMGGLVSRSAHYYAMQEGFKWPQRWTKLFFVGTPHHGAPMERAGNWLETMLGDIPYAGSIARLGRLRSAGITDLRYGSIRDEDWSGADRFDRKGDTRQWLPLPEDVTCYAIAATTAKSPGKNILDMPGDGLVPVSSALGWHKYENKRLDIPHERQRTGYGIAHLDLLSNPAVSRQLADWIKA